MKINVLLLELYVTYTDNWILISKKRKKNTLTLWNIVARCDRTLFQLLRTSFKEIKKCLWDIRFINRTLHLHVRISATFSLCSMWLIILWRTITEIQYKKLRSLYQKHSYIERITWSVVLDLTDFCRHLSKQFTKATSLTEHKHQTCYFTTNTQNGAIINSASRSRLCWSSIE